MRRLFKVLIFVKIRGALYGLEVGGSLVVVAAAGHQEDGQGEGIV